MSNQKTLETLDLLAFFKVLFRGSQIIFLGTALFALVAYFGSQLLPAKWKAEAYFDKPTTVELGNYYAMYSSYQLLTREQKPTATENTDSSTETETTTLAYQEFKRQLSSYDTLKKFWLGSEYYKLKITGESEHSDAQLLQELINSLKFTAGNTAKNTPDSISLVLDNPKRAMELLDSFIAFANNSAKSALYLDLVFKWKTLFDETDAALKAHLEGQNWQSKLNMIKSISPLDDRLMSYRFIKSPTTIMKASPDSILWASMFGFLGFLMSCALVILLHLRRSAKLNSI